ncbi:MAG TPA: orotidine-5'-phosphate decarboxylase [Alphaproteobacteria bacterium]|nr:orotidine-5'-phosphate decarboxylase [Alphaproteobacteria bacterium]
MSAERILCAIDTADLGAALDLAEALAGRIGGLKIGKQLFTAHGPEAVARITGAGHQVFLDLKFHDIPATVAAAVAAAAALGCFVLTVHASGGPEMLRAAARATAAIANPPLVVGVTVLTSLNDGDLDTVGQSGPVPRQVLRLAELARECGLGGVVCSPHEITALRGALGGDFKLIVPGVRPDWAGADDQKRIMTPAEAVAVGADYLVIGRPITRAADPAEAAGRIADEIAAGAGR